MNVKLYHRVRTAHTSQRHSQRDISTHISRSANNLIYLSLPRHLAQFKYLDKDEFKDLRSLKRLHLDGNQLSVVVDNLFIRQKSLELLGEFSSFEII